MANYLAENEGYDEVWLLISPQNPMKRNTVIMDENFRLDLLNKAVGDYSKIRVSTIEWEMPQPSYTINTFQRLRMKYPEDTFDLIIGSDNWATFHRWKDYQLILKNFKILIYPRRGSDRIVINHPNVRLCRQAPKIEISSTVIRQAILRGKDLRFFMPPGLFEAVAASGLVQPDPEPAPTVKKTFTHR
jgi:nicotinate-nucleotide adenylyltransferase